MQIARPMPQKKVQERVIHNVLATYTVYNVEISTDHLSVLSKKESDSPEWTVMLH